MSLIDPGFMQMATKSKEVVLLCLLFRLMKETGRNKITMTETEMRVIVNMQPFPIYFTSTEKMGTMEKLFMARTKEASDSKPKRKFDLT